METMLHMVVNTHDAADCAFRGKEEADLLVGAVNGFTAPGAVDGLEVRGSWVNRSGHEVFVLVDAPSAHVIESAMLAADLVGRTHSRILPVVAADDAFPTDRR
jgi:hypothetical protein